MEKIALLPGGFKPPHAGHYNMAKWLAANTDTDTVVVKVGSKEREGITRDQSLAMWNIYRSTDSDPLAKRLTILPSNSPSPVRDVYDFIELEAPEGSMVYLALGEKDADDKRYASIPKFAEPRGIQFKTVIVPPQSGGVSGTQMRGFIKEGKKDQFLKYLPEHLSLENKDKIWSMLEASIEEELYNPDDHVLDYMKSSEWKAGHSKPDDIPPSYKYKRGGIYTGGGMGAGGMYEGEEVDEMMGTMNNQEKAKHAKNLKKLKKAMRKQGDQMIPVPDYIKGTLTRKLHEKVTEDSIICDNCGWDWKIKDGGDDLYICHKCDYDNTPKLHEGRYDQEVLMQSRYIINIFKAELGRNFEGESEGNIDGIEYTLETRLILSDIEELGPLPFVVNGQADEDTVVIQINYNPEGFPAAYNDLIAEVKDTLRHELEHVGQYAFGKGVEPDGTDPDDVSSFEYFTLDFEIPAFVQGLYKNAKTKKITLTQAIDNFLEEREAELTDEESAKVKEIWIKWAKENLPKAQFEMKESKLFSKNWWENQINEHILEAKANTHLTHLEELVLTQGQDGYNQAKSFLFELIKNLKGEDNTIKNVSVKWDGAPAVFTGINPDNGQFFVGTKSVFNKEPKINYSSKDIDVNHGHAPGLAKKLKLALEYLPSLGIKGILQGDFMFDNNDIETKDIDGTSHYTFRPNTIRYAVEANSELGKKIITAQIGIIFHTTYDDLKGSGASFGADVSGLKKNPKVWFDDAYFKDDTGILLSDEEEQSVLEKIKQADQIKVNYEGLPSSFLNIYINSEIRVGEFLNNPLKSYDNFLNWFQSKIDKKMEKLKSDRGREKLRIKSEEETNNITSNKENIINAFKLSKLLAEAKTIFITKYDKAVATKHFIDNGDGTLRVTKAEGFVAVDHTENGIKLVDRMEFSKNNFNAGKPGAKK